MNEKVGITPKIAIISSGVSDLPEQLVHHLDRCQANSGVLLPLEPHSGLFCLDAVDSMLNGVELSCLQTVWIHGFNYENPVIPKSNDHRDWSVWQYDYLTTQQEYSALFSLFQELNRRGVKVINPPEVHIQNFMKVALLERLRKSGFLVPDLICTNDPKQAELFLKHHGLVVWRPASGRAGWQLFEEKQRQAFVLPDTTPILLAQVSSGPLVRVYCVDHKPVLCLQQKSPEYTPPMESLEKVKPFLLSEEQTSTLSSLADSIGLDWGVVTVVPTEKGLMVYDVDSDPILDWLPTPHRDYLLHALALSLTGLGELKPIESDQPLERPTLFLRRMLEILFRFEHSKRQQ